MAEGARRTALAWCGPPADAEIADVVPGIVTEGPIPELVEEVRALRCAVILPLSKPPLASLAYADSLRGDPRSRGGNA